MPGAGRVPRHPGSSPLSGDPVSLSGTRSASIGWQGLLTSVAALSLTLVVAAVAQGVTFGLRLVLVALAVPGLVLLPAVLARPRLVLVGVVVVSAANLGAVGAGLGIPGITKAVLLLGAVAAWLGVRRGQLMVHSSLIYLTLLAFGLAQAGSLLFAVDRVAGLVALADLAQSAILLLVLVTLASAPGGPATLAVTLVSTMAALAGLTAVQEFALGNATDLGGLSRVPKGADVGGRTGRHAGPYYDANFWARDLVLFLPLAFAWLASTARRRVRAGAAMAALMLVTGVYLTQSRGAFLAVAVAAVTYLALSGPRQRRLLWGLPVALGLLAALPGVGSRLATVAQVAQAFTGGGDPSLVGRAAALRLGLAMVQDRPLLGVGKANFLVVQPEYQRLDPTFAERTLAPHNLYLELAAESGLLGLLTWLAFFGCALWLALRLRRRTGDWQRAPATLPAALVASLVGWAFASLFLHLAEFHLLVMLVALIVVLHAQSDPAPTGPAKPPPQGRFLRRLAGATAVVCWLEALVAAAVVLPVIREPWEAVGYSTVAARDAEANPYERDVAGRSVINATYTAIMEEQSALLMRDLPEDDAPAVTVAASPTSLLLTVTAVSADRNAAVTAAQSVLARAAARIDATEGFYVLRLLGDQAQVERIPRVDVGQAAVAMAVALLVGGAAGLSVLAAGAALRIPSRAGTAAAQ